MWRVERTTTRPWKLFEVNHMRTIYDEGPSAFVHTNDRPSLCFCLKVNDTQNVPYSVQVNGAQTRLSLPG